MHEQLVGHVNYFVYSSIELEELGYARHGLMPVILTHCPICAEYTYFYWMQHNTSHDEVVVCEICENHTRATQFTEFVK